MIGVVLALGFLLLLVALQAPLIAALGVLTNLLAVGAAFGVARLIFQNGHGAGLLGFESQGFLDAWAPVFFFAMIFAISMDYTVFLLSSAKEHYDRSGDPREAMVGGLAHSGRVIFAAAAVMVAVFFTFALSGPLPPKEMGVILGIAVLLDAMLVRLDPDPDPAARLRPLRLGAAALARPHPARRPLRTRLTLELWQAESCPATRRVRERLTELGVGRRQESRHLRALPRPRAVSQVTQAPEEAARLGSARCAPDSWHYTSPSPRRRIHVRRGRVAPPRPKGGVVAQAALALKRIRRGSRARRRSCRRPRGACRGDNP